MKISYRAFDGEIPKWAPDLLPNQNAQYSLNGDFSDGKLSSLKDGELLGAMVNNPVAGLYTEDGVTFYTWDHETFAFKTPIVDDAYSRVYFLTPSVGDFMVTTTTGMANNGPSPNTGNTWKVGVPRPTVAPVLATSERTTYPDYPNATFNATAWWDYNGTQYSAGAVTLTQVTALRSYTFPQPAFPATPPANVTPVLCLRLQVKNPDNNNEVILDVTVRSSGSGRSNAVPGSVEITMTVNSTGTASIDFLYGAVESRAYTYTYGNIWNEESAPAPPATISPTYVQDVAVTTAAADFTGYQAYSKTYVYRTYGTNTTYIRTTVTGTGTAYTDSSTHPDSLGIALESTDWYPPVSALAGVALMPGGWFATFRGNILYKHEPYRPHAVPYTESFAKAIRGIIPSEAGLVVTTADGVYLVPGVAPSAEGTIKLDSPQPGIAQRSMANLDGAVAYASNDGVTMVTGSVVSMDASQKLFSRQSWRLNYGDILGDFSMRFACYDGQLVATSNTQAKGFVLRLDENAGSFTRLAKKIDATFVLPITDALYFSQGANVYQFNAGAAMQFDWWSKEFVFPYDVTFGAAKIEASGPVTVTVYADGNVWYTTTVTSGFFRIPSVRAGKWSVRLVGSCSVEEFQMAQSMGELKGV